MTTVGYGDMSSVSSPLHRPLQYSTQATHSWWCGLIPALTKTWGKPLKLGKNTDNALHAPWLCRLWCSAPRWRPWFSRDWCVEILRWSTEEHRNLSRLAAQYFGENSYSNPMLRTKIGYFCTLLIESIAAIVFSQKYCNGWEHFLTKYDICLALGE